jgi:hypothetical protein
MELEIVPVIEDAQLQEVFEQNRPGTAKRKRRG